MPVSPRSISGTSASEWIDIVARLGSEGDATADGRGGDDGIWGTSGSDSLLGGAGNDSLWGHDGNDTLVGGTGVALLYGGSGNDSLVGGSLNDSVWGGSGADIMVLSGGSDLAYGEEGADVIDAGSGNNTVFGGADGDSSKGGAGADEFYGDDGDDTLLGGEGANRLNGGEGADRITAGAGNDTVDGGAGGDHIHAGAGHNTVWAGEGDDRVTVAGGHDDLSGGDGNDLLTAGDGRNTVHGGEGNDTVTAGTGNDVVTGGNGDDSIAAGSGANIVHGGEGIDHISAGDGNDSITGDAGNDFISAGNGANTLHGGEGLDNISAGTGNDSITGDGGGDFITAGAGRNTVHGGEGDDDIFTLDGNDSITGDGGSDTLDVGGGANTVHAGEGNDEVFAGSGNDSITGDGGDDFISAGGGRNTVFAGDGDDFLVFTRTGTVSGGLMDGGSGTDTLRLDFTLAEWLDAATQRDVGRYATFLDSGRAGWETFRGFGLTIQGVEKAFAQVDGKFQDLADAKVTANADAWAIGESGKATGNVTANDVVPDLIREVKLVGAAPQGLTFNADGSFTFETGGRFEYLAKGEEAKVTFDYQVTDANGDKGTAKATITITGENDKPVLSLGDGDSASASLTETDTTLSATGSITLTDVDTKDVVTASVVSVTRKLEGLASLPANFAQSLLGMLQVASADTAQTAGGKVNWTFTSGPSGNLAFDFLPAGAKLTLTYTVRVDDGSGGTADHQVVVTITGTNDGATITGNATGELVEDSTAIIARKLKVTDADRGEAVFAEPDANALDGTYGTFTFDADSGNWTYKLDNGRAVTQALAAGEVQYDTLEVSSLDGSAVRTISVKVTGANDAPTTSVGADDSAAATLDETNAGLTASGAFTVTDVDIKDIVSAVVTGVTFGGATLPASVRQAAAGFLTVSSTDDATSAGGKVAWVFDSKNEAFNSLRANQAATLTYEVEVSDGQGGKAKQLVAITIQGTNDAPTLGAIASPAAGFAELTDASAQDIAAVSGSLSVNDRDIGDTLTAEILGVTVTRSGGGALPDGFADAFLKDALAFGSVTSNGATRQVAWQWNPNPADLDFLSATEVLTVTYSVRTKDNSGGASAPGDLVFQVIGTNDAPVLGAVPPTVLDFDDLPLADSEEAPIPTYGGFTWAQTGAFNPSPQLPNLGYVATSGQILAFFAEAEGGNVTGYPLNGGSPMVIRRADGADFTFLKATFSAGTRDQVWVTATAMDDGAEVGTFGFWVYRNQPTVIDFSAPTTGSFRSIDELRFDAESFFGFDDFTFTEVDPRVFERADGAADENTGQLTAAGSFAFSDPDGLDTHSVTVAKPGATLGALTASVVNGSVVWDYAVDAALLDSLGAGQTQVESFDITLNDGKGGEVTQRIDVTLVGTNDLAVIGNPSNATVTEDMSPNDQGMLVATGFILIEDADAGEAKLKTAVVSADGNLGTLTLAAGGTYSYAVANDAVQYLKAGESKIDTFTVEALDGTTSTVSFTVDGANEPVRQLGFSMIQEKNHGANWDYIYIDNVQFGLNSSILYASNGEMLTGLGSQGAVPNVTIVNGFGGSIQLGGSSGSRFVDFSTLSEITEKSNRLFLSFDAKRGPETPEAIDEGLRTSIMVNGEVVASNYIPPIEDNESNDPTFIRYTLEWVFAV